MRSSEVAAAAAAVVPAAMQCAKVKGIRTERSSYCSTLTAADCLRQVASFPQSRLDRPPIRRGNNAQDCLTRLLYELYYIVMTWLLSHSKTQKVTVFFLHNIKKLLMQNNHSDRIWIGGKQSSSEELNEQHRSAVPTGIH